MKFYNSSVVVAAVSSFMDHPGSRKLKIEVALIPPMCSTMALGWFGRLQKLFVVVVVVVEDDRVCGATAAAGANVERFLTEDGRHR